MKTAFITGVTGQDGAYLTKMLLEKGYRIIGTTRLNSKRVHGLNYLNVLEEIELQPINLLDRAAIESLISHIKPDEIYHLAAQSSVSTSYENPFDTISFNVNSTLNILECIRLLNAPIKLFNAVSSEMFGNQQHLPITEETPFNPVSPYAASKASTFHMIQSYRCCYDIFCVNGVLFNHESVLREETFFIKKIIKQALDIKKGRRKYIYVGNIDIKRDFGHSKDYVAAMWKMLQIDRPDDFIICSGKSILLRDIVYYVFDAIGIDKEKLQIDESLYRREEIKDIYGCPQKSIDMLDWRCENNFFNVLDAIITEEEALNRDQ